MKLLLMGLVFWAGINDALLVAVASVLGSHEAATIHGSGIFSPVWACALAAFLVLAKSLEKSIASWITSLQRVNGKPDTETRGPVIPVVGIALAMVALMFCGGCKGPVPANSISIVAPSGKYLITTPKNVDVSKFEAKVESNGMFTLKFERWSSTNDPQVIDKAYAGQAHVMDTMLRGVGKIAGEITEKAIQGAKTAGVDASDASRPLAARAVPPPSAMPTYSVERSPTNHVFWPKPDGSGYIVVAE